MAESIKRQRIVFTGRVQGVGFRPAVYRLATELGLAGTVFNDTLGVTIELQGGRKAISAFLDRLQDGPDKPPLARMESCLITDMTIDPALAVFTITPSDPSGTARSEVTADMATCKDCLRELMDTRDFRYHYPFINCTNCGPRYSIVKTIPYDRPHTSMSEFDMCPRCAAQYHDVRDRRFHAQPVACPTCGPGIWLTDSKGHVIETQSASCIQEAARLLHAGQIVALKGLGGFHLAVDALNNEAVLRLRQRKHREAKPFALMTASVDRMRRYVKVNAEAEALLLSPEAPIVLLPRRPDCAIAEAVATGVSTLGFMVCYTPLHHLIFAQGLDVLVMTSGNISDEPLICDNDTALERLGDVADAFLLHDRQIYRQVDDSIVHFMDNTPALVRRARGYMPTPLLLNGESRKQVFAAGADLKNTFAFVKQHQLMCSEHIGDLADVEVYHHYVRSQGHLAGLLEVEPQVVVCDMHPGYYSTQYARSLSTETLISVQHHWAHAAAVLAEHGEEGPVIALIADGTGFGADGAIWGCECLWASLERYERLGHLTYYPLAGSDKASKEAIRPVLALLNQAYGDVNLESFSWLLDRMEPDGDKRRIICTQLEHQVNTVSTSSLGRVFDAVAAIVGLGTYNAFDAQLPMALESIVRVDCDDCYPMDCTDAGDGTFQLHIEAMIRAIVEHVHQAIEPGIIAAMFHNSLAAGLFQMALKARDQKHIDRVVLGGGVFCNRYLADVLIRRLRTEGFDVLYAQSFPANDGGISIGQAAIGARTCG